MWHLVVNGVTFLVGFGDYSCRRIATPFINSGCVGQSSAFQLLGGQRSAEHSTGDSRPSRR
jgi:hypothetical protein